MKLKQIIALIAQNRFISLGVVNILVSLILHPVIANTELALGNQILFHIGTLGIIFGLVNVLFTVRKEPTSNS